MSEPGSGDRISELFTQALGEQVAEERKIQQVLAEVKASLARVEDVTGEALRDTIRTTVQATTGPELTELHTGLAALDHRVGELLRRLEHQAEAIAALPTGVEMDAVGISLASLRATALTRDDVDAVLRASDRTALSPSSPHGAPTAREIAAEISGGLAGLRADLGEELTELVEYRLDSLPTAAAISALADQVAAVPQAVTDAVRASELRLRAHIDEAVLALAEAVLNQPPSDGPVPLPPPVPVTRRVEPVLPVSASQPGPPPPLAPPASLAPAVSPAVSPTAVVAAPAYLPTAVSPAIDVQVDPDDPENGPEDEEQSRRRWFRKSED